MKYPISYDNFFAGLRHTGGIKDNILAPSNISGCPRHTLGPADCSGHPADYYLADPNDCQKFYQCAHGRAVQKVCSRGTLWNDWNGKKGCNWPRNVDCCKGTGQYTGLCSDEAVGTYLPHPEDCQKFYQCDHGHPVEKTCAYGLLWNNVLVNCDWPSNVQCS